MQVRGKAFISPNEAPSRSKAHSILEPLQISRHWRFARVRNHRIGHFWVIIATTMYHQMSFQLFGSKLRIASSIARRMRKMIGPSHAKAAHNSRIGCQVASRKSTRAKVSKNLIKHTKSTWMWHLTLVEWRRSLTQHIQGVQLCKTIWPTKRIQRNCPRALVVDLL